MARKGDYSKILNKVTIFLLEIFNLIIIINNKNEMVTVSMDVKLEHSDDVVQEADDIVCPVDYGLLKDLAVASSKSARLASKQIIFI